MAFAYVLRQCVWGIGLFFRHWYHDGALWAWGLLLKILRSLERRLALRVNFFFLLKPLYQEYNIVGFVLGFLFRFFRIVLGGILYFCIGVVVAIFFALWAALPVYLLYNAIRGFF